MPQTAHVHIKAPCGDDLNRELLHSANVRLICDAKYVLLNVVGLWPGGTNDAILCTSAVGMCLEDSREVSVVLPAMHLSAV